MIVGDICTTHDADRLAQSGAPVIQINTDAFGGDCHLAAHVVERAVADLDLDAIDLLIVENIGNLVCPAEFDIGEDKRVVVLSVTEGEDKPAKYPLMFRECDATLLNKIDLLPYLDFDMDLVRSSIGQHPPRHAGVRDLGQDRSRIRRMDRMAGGAGERKIEGLMAGLVMLVRFVLLSFVVQLDGAASSRDCSACIEANAHCARI